MYIFTFCLLGLFAFDDVFLKNKKYYVLFTCITIFWLIFHDGFHWGMGTDWDTYHNFFTNCLTNNQEGFEIGYVLLSQAVRVITENYTVFLVLHAIIVYSLVSRSILRYSVNPFFSFFFFYCMMLPYLGMNRQYIAFAICIFSYQFVFERKAILFISCIAIAMMFHKSALLFGLAYFLNKEISIKYVIAIFLVAVIISLSGVMNKLPLGLFAALDSSAGDKLDFYSNNDTTVSSGLLFTVLGLLKRGMWIILAIAYKNGIKNKNRYFDFFFNTYFIGAIVYIIFNNTVLQVIIARGLLYYNVSEIFLIPYLLTIFATGVTKQVMFFAVIVYGVFTIQKGMDAYVQTLGYDVFKPYNSVLIDDTYNVYEK